MEKNGLIVAVKKDSPVGPKRKYFSLTKDGENELKEFYSNWIELSQAVNSVLKNGG